MPNNQIPQFGMLPTLPTQSYGGPPTWQLPPPKPYNPYLGNFQKPFGTQDEVNAGIAKFLHHPGDNAQRPGLFGRVGHVLSKGAHDLYKGFTGRQARTHLWPIAAAAIGGGFATGALGGGAGAGAYGGTAATVNPFAAGLGGGTSWAPIAGGGMTAVPALGGAAAGGSGVLPTTTAAGVGAGGFYGPAGNWTAGTAGGDFGTLAGGAAATPWYNTYLGQTGINTGLNLLGGYLQNRAIGKAQSQQQKDIEKRIRQALAMLAPEHIMALAQQFLPQMGANANLAGQTAIQAVREQAARTGQLENPRALSFEAGTRAKLASDVQQRAFEAAMNNAGAQASAITGAPYTPIQPQTGFAEALTNSANQAWLSRAISQARQQQQTGTPYKWPGAPQWIGGPF